MRHTTFGDSIMHRRSFVGAGATLALTQMAGFVSPARADAALMARIMAPGPLPEKAFGSVDAPVTIVEYASITCHFCMKFHSETWPGLKEKYVDTGQVRFMMREFPLDPLATAGFMLARCAGDEKWYPVLDLLYRTKETWGHAQNPADALLQTLRQAGFTQDSFDACLRNDKLFKDVRQVAERGSRDFGVNSTPTFFINGEKRTGALTLAQFDAILEPMLAAKR
jgi:protein-disulfide isomerase